MSGRPKTGQRPQCATSGPCLATRIRASTNTTRDTQCRNCATTPYSLDAYTATVRVHSEKDLDPSLHALWRVLTQHPTLNPFRTLRAWFLYCYTQARVHGQIQLEALPAVSISTNIRTDRIVCELYNVALNIDDTFHHRQYCVDDFIYCKRHSFAPTYMRIKHLLQSHHYQAAVDLIQKYEVRVGKRVPNARQYYNEQSRRPS